MLSLKRCMDEVGEYERRSQAALQAYFCALVLMEEHAVPIHKDLVYNFRCRLKSLRRAIGPQPNPETLADSREALEAEMKEFADRSSQILRQKDDEILKIIQILADAAATLRAQNDAQSGRLGQFTKELEAIGKTTSLPEIRRRLAEEVRELKGYVSSIREQRESSVEQLRQELWSFRQRLEKAEVLAFSDALTGIANRAEGERQLAVCAERGEPFSILFFDLNDFKPINDRWGHHVGDLVLKTFARRLAQSVRPGDTVSRWGGDEFLAILPGCRLATALDRAKKLSGICGGSYTLAANGQEVVLNVSAAIGAAEYCAGETIHELFARADRYLYREKQCPTLS
jgi:diguanylate cyclase (GGDEF)-like protein